MFLSLPVVEDDETAYKNTAAQLHPVFYSFFTCFRSYEENKIKSMFFMIAPYSVSNSCSGRSGRINPSTPPMLHQHRTFQSHIAEQGSYNP
jgi:hypothetical protein